MIKHEYLVILVLVVVIGVIYSQSEKNGLVKTEQFIPVVPADIFPGTYWRNNSLRQSDQCCGTDRGVVGCRPPQALDVEFQAPVASPSSFGQDYEEYKRLPIRYPEPRFQMVCSVNDHLQRNCYWKKVYNNYQ